MENSAHFPKHSITDLPWQKGTLQNKKEYYILKTDAKHTAATSTPIQKRAYKNLQNIDASQTDQKDFGNHFKLIVGGVIYLLYPIPYLDILYPELKSKKFPDFRGYGTEEKPKILHQGQSTLRVPRPQISSAKEEVEVEEEEQPAPLKRKEPAEGKDAPIQEKKGKVWAEETNEEPGSIQWRQMGTGKPINYSDKKNGYSIS